MTKTTWQIDPTHSGVELAVKHIVRRVMNEYGAETSRFFRHDARRDAIDLHRKIGLGLGAVNVVVGGSVDDRIRLRLANRAADRVRTREVHPAAIKSNHGAERGERALQLPADLAVAARNEDALHQGNTSASFNGRPARSLGDRIGSPFSGHAMPRSRSFQAMQRSCSGA